MSFRRMLNDDGCTTYKLADHTATPEIGAWVARPVGWGEAPAFFGRTAIEAVRALDRHYLVSAVPYDQKTLDLLESAEPLPPAETAEIERKALAAARA